MKNKVNSKLNFLSTLALTGILSTGCSEMKFSDVVSLNDSLTLPNQGKLVTSSQTVAYGNKDVDFLLVLDDSNSMLPELTKLSQKLSGFVSSLEAGNINWQMCLTTTRGISSPSGPTYGASLPWANYLPSNSNTRVLKKGTPNLNSIFTSTIQNLSIGGGLSGDERGSKAFVDHLRDKSNNNCYRAQAALSVILISDEDIRSIGGDLSKVKANDASTVYQALENDDLPATSASEVKRLLGESIPFTFNSIIVKPNDLACEADQDKDTSPSHPGYLYQELSLLTEGGVGSICEEDYSTNLNSFKDKIINSLSQLSLECSPIDAKIQVTINGKKYSNYKLADNVLKFDYSIPEGTQIELNYRCQE